MKQSSLSFLSLLSYGGVLIFGVLTVAGGPYLLSSKEKGPVLGGSNTNTKNLFEQDKPIGLLKNFLNSFPNVRTALSGKDVWPGSPCVS